MKLNVNRNRMKLKPESRMKLNLGASHVTGMGARKLAEKQAQKDGSMGYLKNIPIEVYLTSRQRRAFYRMSASKRKTIIAKIEKELEQKTATAHIPVSEQRKEKPKERITLNQIAADPFGAEGNVNLIFPDADNGSAFFMGANVGASFVPEPTAWEDMEIFTSIKKRNLKHERKGQILPLGEAMDETSHPEGLVVRQKNRFGMLKQISQSDMSGQETKKRDVGKGALLAKITSKSAKTKLEEKKEKQAKKLERSEMLSRKKITARDIERAVVAGVGNAILAEQGKENEQLRETVQTLQTIKNIPGQAIFGIRGASTVGKWAYAVSKGMAEALRRAAISAAPFLVIGGLVLILLCSFLFLIMDEQEESKCPYGNLYYWIYWETGTWEPEKAYRMVHGDNGNAYGIQFDRRYPLTDFVKSCYDADPEGYACFRDYYGKRIPQSDMGFASAWETAFEENPLDFGERQKQYVYDYYYLPAEAYLKERGLDLKDRPEVVKGSVMSFTWHTGWQTAAEHILNAKIEVETEDRDFIEKIYEKRTKEYPRFTNRFTEEKAYALSLLLGDEAGFEGMNGEEFSDATFMQKAVAQFALQGSSWGLRQGWCQKWVATTYQKALGGAYRSSCCASSAGSRWIVSRSETIPIGATVYGTHSWSGTRCGCGRDAGHVGIYVGDGKIANLGAGYTLSDFNAWVRTYGYAGWGWNGGRSLK